MSIKKKPFKLLALIPGLRRQLIPRASMPDCRLELETLEDRLLLTAGNGLQAQYFDDADLTDIVLVRNDSDISFDWGNGSPDAAIGVDSFSVRWSGQVEAQYTEAHSFIVNANDGARLWVNGQLLIDQFDSNSLADATATIDLIAGRRYDVQLEFREQSGDASVSLEWSSASLVREVIPSERLFAGQRGSITAERWNSITGSDLSDLTGDTDFPNSPDNVTSLNSLATLLSQGDDYGQRLRGFLHAPVTGPYTFYLAADESAGLWLSNSDEPGQKQLIAEVDSATLPQQWDNGPAQKSAVIYLAAGQRYYLEVLHKEATQGDHVAVGWQIPGTANIEVIDGEHLSPILPEVRIYSELPNVSEGSATPASFEIVRDGPVNNPLTISYSTSGSAINGTDYAPLPGSITIPAGSDSATLLLTPTADGLVEGDETAFFELQQGDGYRVGAISQRTANGKLQDDEPAPVGGSNALNSSDLADFSHFGGSFSTANDPVYGDVIQANITTQHANPWNSQLRQVTSSAIEGGDILLVEFVVRSTSASGEVEVLFERSTPGAERSLEQAFPVRSEWSRIQLPFVAYESYAAGQARINLRLGFQIQTLQFTDFKVLNYGPARSLGATENLEAVNNGGSWGTGQIVAVDGQPFDSAFEGIVTTVPAQNWRFRAVALDNGSVNSGDTMRVTFWIRSTDGTNPQAKLIVQSTANNSSVYSGPVINLTNSWVQQSIDIAATADYPREGLRLAFNLGYGLQTVQVGGLEWTNLNNAADLADLPQQYPAASYGGRAGTDAWRQDAEDRIEDERKSQLAVNVMDVNGQAVDGAVVHVRQSKHDFKFGAAVNAFDGRLDPNTSNASFQKYQSEINRLFNTIVLNNSFKWPSMERDRQRAIDAGAFAVSNELYLRGHNAIWPSRSHMPDSVWDEYDSLLASSGQTAAEDYLRGAAEARLQDVATTFGGLVGEWDLVNEPFSSNDIMAILGDSIVVDWFQQYRALDPTAKLALNDYGIFPRNGMNAAHRANFDYWLGLLNNANVLDVIGEQSHYHDYDFTDIDLFGTLVDSYHTQFGAEIAITEFDVDTRDEQLQADYLRDYMTMAFSQSGVTQFIQWGFWRYQHPKPLPALYQTDFSIKPNGQAYEDLVFGDWWSDEQSTTRSGASTANVFLGEYDVIVEYDGVAYNSTVTVDASGNSNVTVNLPVEAYTNIIDRGVGYGGSTYFAEDEMPTSIVALLPGQTSTAANYSSYTRGINRVIVDIAGPASGSLDAASDFEFRVGNTDEPSEWLLLDATSSIPLPGVSIAAGDSAGISRVMLSWPDNVIENGWLQITVKATANTGLSQDDVFYFGNQVGDVNGDVSIDNRVRVNSFDTGLVRLNQSPVNTVGIESVYDVDRNGLVNSFDTGRVRLNQTLGGLLMFTAPLDSPPSAPSAPLVSAPEVRPSAVIAPTTIRDSQRNYLSRLFTRYQNNFRSDLSEARRRELTIRRLHRVAARFATAGDRFYATGDLNRSIRRTEVSLMLKTIAQQLTSETDRSVAEITGEWTVG